MPRQSSDESKPKPCDATMIPRAGLPESQQSNENLRTRFLLDDAAHFLRAPQGYHARHRDQHLQKTGNPKMARLNCCCALNSQPHAINPSITWQRVKSAMEERCRRDRVRPRDDRNPQHGTRRQQKGMAMKDEPVARAEGKGMQWDESPKR